MIEWSSAYTLVWFCLAIAVVLLFYFHGIRRESSRWMSWVKLFTRQGPSDVAAMIRFTLDWLVQTRNANLHLCNLTAGEKPADLLPLVLCAQELLDSYPEHVRMISSLFPSSRREAALRALLDQELALKAIINRWCSHIYAQLLASSRKDPTKLDALVDEFKLTAESTANDYDFLGAVLDASTAFRKPQ